MTRGKIEFADVWPNCRGLTNFAEDFWRAGSTPLKIVCIARLYEVNK